MAAVEGEPPIDDDCRSRWFPFCVLASPKNYAVIMGRTLALNAPPPTNVDFKTRAARGSVWNGLLGAVAGPI
ncbi:MAG: hypothetical protein ACKPJD_09835, partial [Planctomycetaceae bacterium]